MGAFFIHWVSDTIFAIFFFWNCLLTTWRTSADHSLRNGVILHVDAFNRLPLPGSRGRCLLHVHFGLRTLPSADVKETVTDLVQKVFQQTLHGQTGAWMTHLNLLQDGGRTVEPKWLSNLGNERLCQQVQVLNCSIYCMTHIQEQAVWNH
jgi:hypothetical protein